MNYNGQIYIKRTAIKFNNTIKLSVVNIKIIIKISNKGLIKGSYNTLNETCIVRDY